MFSWFSKKFSRKLALVFCSVIVLFMTLAGYFFTRAFRDQLIEDLTLNLQIQARLIASQIDEIHWTKKENRKLHELAHQYRLASGCRVTFIDPQGIVLGESELPLEELPRIENHKNRPEIKAAIGEGKGSTIRHNQPVGIDLLYTAIPVYRHDQLIGVVRVAMPLTQVQEKIEKMRSSVLRITLGMVLIAIFAGIGFARSQAKPLQELLQVAHRLSLGEHEARVKILSKDEHGELGKALNILAERVQSTIRELSQDKAELSLILSSMVEAVVAVDTQRNILAVNQAFSRLFDIQTNETLGKPFYEILRQTKLAEILECALGECKGCAEEVQLFVPEERIFEAHALPLRENNRVRGALLVLHDITRIRKLEQIRKEFVANVSHELRTPLASIKGSAESLLEGALNEPHHSQEFVQAIKEDVDRLIKLVDDLLDLSAIESGKRQPKLEPLSLLQVARDAAERLKSFAAKRAVTIEIQEVDHLPEVLADKEQMNQVFLNLIDNAIKFNKEGGKVKISATPNEKFVTITIEDTGVGIPSKDLPRIFERFYRVDKARSQELGGTGLGLSIVKHIVESHKGTVAVESVEGEGSTFRFSIPVST